MAKQQIGTRGPVKWILIVVVSEYEAGDKVMPPLPGVTEDAQRLGDVLQYRSHIPSGETVYLYNKEATKENIIQKIEKIGEEALECDQVIIYFGCHAHRVHGGDNPMRDGMTRYILPYDAAWQTAESKGISTRELAAALKMRASEVVVILDCCYSGGLAGVFWEEFPTLQQENKSRYVIAAARPHQPAVETDRGSLLTQNFCDALEGKVKVMTSSEGLVSVSTAFEHAQVCVCREAERYDYLQRAFSANFLHGPIYLTRIVPTDITKGEADLAFILMPIGERDSSEYQDWRCVFDTVLKPAITQRGFRVVRSDELAGNLVAAIVGAICRAKVVIADISGLNPNVMWELGIAHTLAKRVIIVSQDRQIPTLLKTERVTRYDASQSKGGKPFQKDISVALERIKGTDEPDWNTVQAVLPADFQGGLREIAKKCKQRERKVLDEWLDRKWID